MRRAHFHALTALAALTSLLPALSGCADAPSRAVAPAAAPARAAARAAQEFRFPDAPVIDTAKKHDAAPISLTASDGRGLRLVSVDGRAVVEDPLAFTELRLVFQNPEERTLEGTFSMTLPRGATVSRFAMKVGERWQEGEVVERQRAREAYEDFLHRRQDPALLEQAAGNEFTARVFPIPALGTKEIVISFSHEIGEDTPFTLPLRGLPEIGSLDVVVSRAGAAAPVKELHQHGAAPDADFVLGSKELTSGARGAAGGAQDIGDVSDGLRSGDLVLARVRPLSDAQPDPLSSAVILVDTSASRALDFEAELRLVAALARGVARAGGPDAPLAVACYDQTVAPIFEGAAGAFGEQELARIRERQALGASDLGKALRWAGEHTRGPDPHGLRDPRTRGPDPHGLRDPRTRGPDPHGLRRVVLLSDGVATAGARGAAGAPDVGSDVEQDALRAAAAHLRQAGVERLDVVALGGIREDNVLRTLVTAGLPRDGIVADSARGEADVERRLSSATRSGLAVKIDGARWIWPQTLNGVQPGDEVLVYADVPAAQPVRITVDRKAISPVLRSVERPLLERAWVQAKINHLLFIEGIEGASPSSRQAIVDLSIAHRVLSPYTALLVLETEHDYARFGIDRRGLADILTVDSGRVQVMKRSWPPGKGWGVAAASPPPVEPRPPRAPADPPKPAEPSSPRGELWGDAIGDAFGAGGLGLTGVGEGGGGRGEGIGEGGGGRGEGIGLGRIGTIGHGAGVAPSASMAPAAEPPPSGSGQGFGQGHGRLGGSHRTRPPSVRAGATTVSGRLPPEVIQRVVRQQFGRLRRCYEEGLRVNPHLQGRVSVRFVIGRSGDVTSASDAGSDLPDRRTVACVVRGFQEMSFPRLEGPANAESRPTSTEAGQITVVYPVMFSPGDGTPEAESSGARVAEPSSAPAPESSPPPESEPAPSEPYTGNFKVVMDALAAGNTAEALKTAWTWHIEEPGDVMALVALGEALESSSEPAAAARCYGSLIDLFPSRADMRRFAGERLERIRGQVGLDLALDTYEKAQAERPDHPSSHRLLALAQLKKGHYAKAFEAAAAGLARRYPPGRFVGAERILSEDLGLIAAAWIKAEPARRSEILMKAAKAGGSVEDAPSIRFVLNWETDANDVDFHIRDDQGNHAYYSAPSLPGGGELYADVTTGYGPECFTLRAPREQRAARYTLQAHYYARGPMGYGMGKLEIIEHDGKGGLTFEERPFVVMTDKAFVDLGVVER